MAGGPPHKEQPKFTEVQIQAEIQRQRAQSRLLEAQAKRKLSFIETRSKVLNSLQEQDAHMRQSSSYIFKNVLKNFGKHPPGFYGLFLDLSVTMMVQWRRHQEMTFLLRSFAFREDWHKASTAERVKMIGYNAPGWLHHTLWRKPALTSGLWALRTCLKLYKRF